MSWLRQLFVEESIDFEKRCKMRIGCSIVLFLLGGISLLLAFGESYITPVYLSENFHQFFPGFYSGMGLGLMVASLITIYKNLRYLKSPEIGKKRKIYEADERNRILGLRCWAYTGYSFFLILYIGILISGFISSALTKVLLRMGGIFALLLLVFRMLLRRCM